MLIASGKPVLIMEGAERRSHGEFLAKQVTELTLKKLLPHAEVALIEGPSIKCW